MRLYAVSATIPPRGHFYMRNRLLASTLTEAGVTAPSSNMADDDYSGTNTIVPTPD